MITRAYEFEIVRGEHYLMAFPYDLEGGTQGKDFDELCMMVANWLRRVLEDSEMHGRELPKPTYGHKPRQGGFNMLVQVSAGRETVPKVRASQAARRLGVSRGRVTQLVASGGLEGWNEGRNTWVTVDSLDARLQERKRETEDVEEARAATA